METEHRKKRKNQKVKKIILAVLTAVFAAVFIFSAYKVIRGVREYAKGREVYNSLASQVVVFRDVGSTSGSDGRHESGGEDSSAEPVELAPIIVDFEKLAAQNKDVVGWLYCEGTPVNYPVLQSTDNDYYLRRMINREYNIVGSVFMDYRSAPDLSSLNTIIYGHNMNDDSMFGTFTNYADQSYYEAHPVIWYLTPEKDYKIELIAGYVTDASNEAAYRVYNDADALARHIESSMGGSDFVSGVDAGSVDRIITLSTCSYAFSTARYILIGALQPVPKE